MKKILLFLARLAVISLLFLPLLSTLHQCYKSVLDLLAGALATQAMTSVQPYDGSKNLYTFLVLILATPGLTVKWRSIGVAAGISAFLFADFFMISIWIPYLKTPKPSLANMAVSYGWLIVAHYLLPFLLWLLFSFRQIEDMLRQFTPRHAVTKPN